MSYQLLQYGVRRLSDGACIPEDTDNADYVKYLVWLAGGNTPSPIPGPTAEEIKATLSGAVQYALDAFARTRGYDNIVSACTYAASKVASFAAEGQRCVDLRDTHWATCYTILAAVQAGQRSVPTVAELLDELPTLSWSA